MTSKKKKGFSLIEAIVSVVLMSVAVTVMLGIISIKSKIDVDITKQHTVVEADAFLSDMYNDFYAADSINIAESGTIVSITFNKGTDVNVYEYDSDARACFKNGEERFTCEGLNATASSTNLYVSLKFEGDQMLELDIYK